MSDQVTPEVVKGSAETKRDKGALYKPPTTLDIARQGVEEYSLLLGKLPPETAEFFRSNPQIKRCFTGMSPEVKFEKPFESEWRNIPGAFPEVMAQYEYEKQELIAAQDVINETSSNFHILYTPEIEGEQRETYQFLNISAIRHVMDNYPDLFPEDAKTDTKKWLLENPDFWSFGDKIYGLFSGFPLEAVDAYMSDQPGDRVTSRLDRVFGYMGVDAVRDGEYVEKLEAIFDESGIEKASTSTP